jgi:hypothetical protein
MTATNDDAGAERKEPDRALAVYLRDHFAGSTAGLALARRCRREYGGTALGEVLASIEAEIDEDRQALQATMSLLGVTPSIFKSALGAVAEPVGRLKSNGRIFRRSPSTPVVELEALAAGILTKRNLWRSLRAAASGLGAGVLDVGELDRLIDRATSQLDRVLAAHEQAARDAFGSSQRPPLASKPAESAKARLGSPTPASRPGGRS